MPPDAAFHRGLLIFTAVLAFCVVAIGAWVRLNAAGLGCPDWPACYGHLSAGGAAGDAARIDALYPSQPVIPAKAALEMLHRYLAGTLGLVVAASAFFVWWRGRRTMAAILVLLVVFQALLGMWTVTRRLAPLAVTGHLLGGMSLLALLWWLALDAGAAASRWPRHRLFSLGGGRTGAAVRADRAGRLDLLPSRGSRRPRLPGLQRKLAAGPELWAGGDSVEPPPRRLDPADRPRGAGLGESRGVGRRRGPLWRSACCCCFRSRWARPMC